MGTPLPNSIFSYVILHRITLFLVLTLLNEDHVANPSSLQIFALAVIIVRAAMASTDFLKS